MTSKIWKLDVKDLFCKVGLKKTGLVEMNENAYDFDPKNPEDSWLYPALLGFQELKKQKFHPKSFATIGTGAGIDSIGVYELFQPKEIYQIDINPNIPKIAHKNAKALIDKSVKIETFLGDLCLPLIEKGIKVDLVYANIPNIPTDDLRFVKKVAASQYQERDSEDSPKIFQKWYLTLQYLYLKQAKQVVNSGGVVVDAIGIRVPYEIVKKLFAANGYKKVSELVSVYKVQSEPEDTLLGYSKQEIDSGIEFDFYDHEKAWPFWQKNLKNKKLNAQQIKDALKQFRISATQASKAFEKKGKQAGHVCCIFKATL